MRKILSASIVLLVITTLFTACKSKAKDAQADPQADPQAHPRSVAEAIFAAARSGNYDGLAVLIDADADTDSKMIAQVATDKSTQEEFKKYFSKGKVTGEPTVSGETASVNILFGPDGTKEETFQMVQKNGKWYLRSF